MVSFHFFHHNVFLPEFRDVTATTQTKGRSAAEETGSPRSSLSLSSLPVYNFFDLLVLRIVPMQQTLFRVFSGFIRGAFLDSLL